MGRVNYSGLVIAGLGFFLTRFTVTLALYTNPVRFYLAGVTPLVLGLGLAAFGVALTVADVDRSTVRTTMLWCVIGFAAMLVLVVLTLLGSTTGEMPALDAVRSRTYLSNFLIGGSVGGTLTGLYAARNRRQREELTRQATRLETLNQLLRHQILNALTPIRGFAEHGGDDERASRVIASNADAIEQTVEEVKYLTRSAGRSQTPVAPIDLGDCLETSVAAIREAYPDADVSVDASGEEPMVLANDHLTQVFSHLLDNAVVHGDDDPTVAVAVTETPGGVSVAVSDDGPGLPERERALLEEGSVEEFDDPGTGFGLHVVRFLVESYRGSIDVETDAEGTTITVTFSRAPDESAGLQPATSALHGVRPAMPHLIVLVGASLVAGVTYGIASTLMGGSVAGIGVFYGTTSPVIGWITHEFHSVVFGFMFGGLVSVAPEKYRRPGPIYLAIGLGWGLVVWIGAASIVAPTWLKLLGIPAPLPSFRLDFLVNHVVWGLTVGGLTALGYEHVTPWLGRHLGN